MDLETLVEEQPSVELESFDTEALVADTEELAHDAQDVESTLSTISGLVAMDETFETLTVGDQESLSDNQLTAFRAGIATTMIAANSDMKTAFGIDTEATYVDATTAYAKDVEGIKEFFKKIWAKIKAGLIKANSFFKKMFVKFLNLVSFRKGTIEKLIEDVDASSTGNETLKASKFGIVKKLAAPATAAGKLSGDKVVLDTTVLDVLYSGGEDNFVVTVNKTIKDAAKGLKAVTDGKMSLLDSDKISTGIKDSLSAVLKDKDTMKALEKVDASSMKKFKKSKDFKIIRSGGNKLYVVGTSEKSILTGTVKVKADKVKTLEGLNSAFLKDGLKRAENTNENFKDLVNTAFEMYDDAESLANTFSNIKVADTASDNVKAAVKAGEKMGKNLVSASPWIAFHTSMGLYKAVGYTMGLAKAYLKDVKDDKDDK